MEGRGSGNSRNGSYPKTVTTEIGKVDLAVPRDRNSTFEPVTVPKGQRRLDGLTGNIFSLYAKGMTTGDIQAHLGEIYGTDISRDTISRITDAVVEDLIAWQNRPRTRCIGHLRVTPEAPGHLGLHRLLHHLQPRADRKRAGPRACRQRSPPSPRPARWAAALVHGASSSPITQAVADAEHVLKGECHARWRKLGVA